MVGKEDGILSLQTELLGIVRMFIIITCIINSDDDFIRDRHNTKLYRDHELRPYQYPFRNEAFECKMNIG